MQGAAQALAKAHASRSPLITAAAHTKKLADMAKKFDREVVAGFNRATDAYRAGLAEIRARIDEKVNFKEDGYGGETRAYFRTLSAVEKTSLISELLGANRAPELAALLKAPRSTTGLTEEMIERTTKSLYATHAAPELAEMERLSEVLEGATAAYRAGSDLARSLTDPAELARIEREAEAATEASTAFDQALA